MITKKILTGSREFFKTDNNDYDYIIIKDDQEETFKHIRESNICYFTYKEMTKEEYLTWLEKENKWYLNFAPLVNQEFLRYMNIDIFNTDKARVYEIMRNTFKLNYHGTINTLNKYIYRMYIYSRYIKNGNYNLTEKELQTALDLKNKKYKSQIILKELFEFYGYKDNFETIKKRIKMDTKELDSLTTWFKEYFDIQLIQASWQEDFKPSYDQLFKKEYLTFKELKKEANIVRNRIKELKEELYNDTETKEEAKIQILGNSFN